MSGWRLSAGDLDSTHCLGEEEWRRLVDTTFVLGELTCPSNLQYCFSFRSKSLQISGWRLSAGDLDSPHCLGEEEWGRLVESTFVLGELTYPSTLQYCYSFLSYSLPMSGW